MFVGTYIFFSYCLFVYILPLVIKNGRACLVRFLNLIHCELAIILLVNVLGPTS